MHLRSFVELVKYSHLFLSCVLSLPPGLLNGLSRSPPACLMDWLRIDGVFFMITTLLIQSLLLEHRGWL